MPLRVSLQLLLPSPLARIRLNTVGMWYKASTFFFSFFLSFQKVDTEIASASSRIRLVSKQSSSWIAVKTLKLAQHKESFILCYLVKSPQRVFFEKEPKLGGQLGSCLCITFKQTNHICFCAIRPPLPSKLIYYSLAAVLNSLR